MDLTDAFHKVEIEKYKEDNKARKKHLQALNASSASPEWYTPSSLVKCMIDVLGEIDLDPCSNPGEPNVPAKVHYTKDDDGLSREWHGRVFMNPPYGPVIKDWTAKLEHEYQAGRVTEAIALVPARVDTKWFDKIAEHTICFLTGRIKFELNGEASNPSPFPSMAIYLGKDDTAFRDVFRPLGNIYRYLP